MNKILSTLLIIFLSIFLISCAEDKMKPTIIDGTHIFEAKELWNIQDKEKTANLLLDEGLLVLEDTEKSAVYESVPVQAKAFKELVLSFNARSLNSGSISFFVSVGNDNVFSDFYLMGSYSGGNYRSFSNQNDDTGRVNIDTLVNKNLENTFIKLKVMVQSGAETKLKNITITTAKEGSFRMYDSSILKNIVLEVPTLSQLSIPTIGNSICSPTSVAMVLNYYMHSLSVTTVAAKVLDVGANIYGNWTFNASFAGSLEGMVGYVEYIEDFQKVIDYINEGVPVILSIKTTSKSDLEGSIMAYPSGHLVVLVGFEEIGGVWYGIVNDPAEYTDEKVLRKYEIEQLLKVWNSYTYIIKKD